LSEKQPSPEEVPAEVVEEEEVSETPEEETKEAAGEAEEEATEEQPSPEEEATAEKAEEEEAEEAREEEEAEEGEEEEAEEGEEEIEIVEERIYTIPFRKVWATPRGKRTPRASRTLRAFVKRHMKAEKVEISNDVNEELWARGIRKPPREIKVRLVKDKEGRVIVYPATAT
jgi:large subunit ribosomal protein L31e